ncbi:6646_t:CDS:1 [Ambispora gerdemannii]|uniref:6646_t:CDS:1 n=1 Tax=Ambispora gerdemannii TaxID=144530 RepID=A0A9N9DLP9_9GLOM|nr:6646_t:CDS:1 [Ambispora gerdemannii]
MSNIFFPSFPPSISVNELIKPRNRKHKQPAKAPNAFMIYRINYCREIRNDRNISQPKISSMASQAWEQESQDVKRTYFEFARQAKEIYLARNAENHVIDDGDIGSSQSQNEDVQVLTESDTLINIQPNRITEDINTLVSETEETSFDNSNFNINLMQSRIAFLESELVSMNVRFSHVTTLKNEVVSINARLSHVVTLENEFVSMNVRLSHVAILENELVSMNARLSHVAVLENELASLRQTISELNAQIQFLILSSI